MRWIIEALGGVTQRDFFNNDDHWAYKLDRRQSDHEDFIGTLISEHDAAMRQATAQLQQTQEMLRQTELRLEKVEEERANASAGWTAEKEEHFNTAQQLLTMRMNRDEINEQRGSGLARIGELEAELDTVKAKLSRPKPRKEPTMAERPY